MNLFDAELQKDEDDAPGYEVSYMRVGPPLGAQQLGLSVYEISRATASARTTTRTPKRNG